MKFFKHGITLALIGFLSLNTMTFAYDAMSSATQKEATPPKETAPVAPKKEAPKEEAPKVQEEKKRPQEEKSLPKEDPSVHIVVKGDTLIGIAKNYNLTLNELLKLNSSLKESDELVLGQKILIKGTEQKPPVKAPVPPTSPSPKTPKLQTYENGIYRGSYLDAGIEQVGLEFTLKEGVIEKAKYRTLTYKGVDYLKPSVKREEHLKNQYDTLIKGLLGKTVAEARLLLQTPEKLVKNIKTETDALTGATLRSQKISSALQDGLNRSPYSSQSSQPSFDDGVYRGIFTDGGQEQVGVEFTLSDNKVSKIIYSTLSYKDDHYNAPDAKEKILLLREQYDSLIQYLIDKDIRLALSALRFPDLIAPNKSLENDALTGATLRSGKVISAITDGLNRGVYTPKSANQVNLDRYLKTYEDGTYRGTFQHKGEQQVALEFKLKGGKIHSIEFKTLAYKGVNYLKDTSSGKYILLRQQYETLIKALLQKPLTAVASLYTPEKIVQTEQIQTDALTGATLRSGKIISAINDALNRGLYKK